MGNVMVGLGMILFGIILFQTAETFLLYPAQTQGKASWPYYTAKIISYILFGAGAIFIVLGFM